MSKCPFFGRCGGCKFDFASPDYCANKHALLKDFPLTDKPVWIKAGLRRRADFCFGGGVFGFFESRSKNIVPLDFCPNLLPQINAVLPGLSKLPWVGTGGCLVTLCDNGIDINITCSVPYVPSDFRTAIAKLPIIRATWNNIKILQASEPVVSFSGHTVNYPSNAFLQPTIEGADILRDLVLKNTSGAKKVADLFCGLGNFTFALNADGFDIVGTGQKRDLFKKPLTVAMLNQYDCVVMDPPRAGALAQCQELIRSNVSKIIYVSCNPQTFRRDMDVLVRGGYKLSTLIPVDQFAGSSHWELFSVFSR